MATLPEMKVHYGVRITVALIIGAILAGLWVLMAFDGSPRTMSPELAVLAWRGVRALWAAILFFMGLGIIGFLINQWPTLGKIADALGHRWGVLISRFESFANSTSDSAFKGRKGLLRALLMMVGVLAFAITMFCIVMPPVVLVGMFAIKPFGWLFENEWHDPRQQNSLKAAAGVVWSFLTTENTKGMLWIYFKGLAVPYILLMAPQKLACFWEGLQEHLLFRQLFSLGRGGSARWAGPRSYRRRGKATSKATFVGRTRFLDAGLDRDRNIGFDDDSHMLTVGCTGSGKAVSVIWPNLAMYSGSVIVLDPKGEHAKMTYWLRAGAERAKGSCLYTQKHFPIPGRYSPGPNPQAYKLDPFDQVPSIPGSNYNPLSEIDIYHDRVREGLSAISDGCVLPEGEKNRHWTEGAKTVLEGIIAHVLSRYDQKHHNLPFIHDLLVEFNPETGIADPALLEEVLVEMRANSVAGGLCHQAVTLLGQRNGESFGNMMATVQRSIKWMGDPSMRKHLSGDSDFKFSEIPAREGTSTRTVYIVSPLGSLMKEQMRWLRVLTNLGITVIRNQPSPAFRTLFILDEFPQLGGQLSAIQEGIVTLRSAGVKLWPFIQQIGQLKKDYGESWNTFISSSHVQAFGVTDLETAEWLSKFLGQFMHTRTEEKRIVHEGPRPLWTATEVMEELGKYKPLQLVIPNDGGFPMRLERAAFKPLTMGGERFRGLDLEGYFEEPS